MDDHAQPAAQEPAPGSEEKSESKADVRWPLSYKMRIPEGQKRPRWWSHDLYRGPDDAPVEVLYSKDKAQSEILAKKFLDEPLVGFDMEWPWDSDKRHRLQEKIGLIQVACEDKIALFHIGLHPGETSDEIIAPSLKKLVESSSIAKIGVCILYADFSRLSKFFSLKPRGALELSHLHRLVKFRAQPAQLTTKLVKLADQVQEHLGYPLSKGGVRTSNWSRPLTQKQINYAANDAYAGFMLFHRMNAKRMALRPTPPLPVFAEDYTIKTWGKGSITDLMLYPPPGSTDVIFAKDFYAPKKEEQNPEPKVIADEFPPVGTALGQEIKKSAKSKKESSSEEPLDASSRLLYGQLAERRLSLAKKQGVPAFRIASNVLLQKVARHRPTVIEDLLKIRGIGKWHQEQYGAEWLEAIIQFQKTNEPRADTVPSEPEEKNCSLAQPTTASRTDRRRKPEPGAALASVMTSNTPLRSTRQLHTGISFHFSEATLDEGDASEVAVLPPTLGHLSSTPPKIPDFSSSKGKVLGQDMDTESPFPLAALEQTPPLKRKREPGEDMVKPDAMQAASNALTPRSKIFRNQLVALSKLVCRKLNRDPGAEPLVDDAILDHIVAEPPRTAEALSLVPGIQKFRRACEDAEVDLLRNITKFAPARF